jgi:hypothetical protein
MTALVPAAGTTPSAVTVRQRTRREMWAALGFVAPALFGFGANGTAVRTWSRRESAPRGASGAFART